MELEIKASELRIGDVISHAPKKNLKITKDPVIDGGLVRFWCANVFHTTENTHESPAQLGLEVKIWVHRFRSLDTINKEGEKEGWVISYTGLCDDVHNHFELQKIDDTHIFSSDSQVHELIVKGHELNGLYHDVIAWFWWNCRGEIFNWQSIKRHNLSIG